MNPPPPDLPPPSPPSNLPPPSAPAGLPPPAAHVSEVIVSKLEQPSAAATTTKKVEEEVPERPRLDGSALFNEAKTWPWKPGQPEFIKTALGLALAAGVAALVSLAGLVIALVVGVYSASYFYRIVHTTLEGSDALPPWPKLSEPVEDLIRPGVRIIGAAIVSHIPLICVHIATDSHVGINRMAEAAGVLIGAAYFPFAALMIVFQERFGAWWPHLVIPAFTRCLPAAKAVIVFHLAMAAAGYVLRTIPWVGPLLGSVVLMISMVVLARMLGMLAAQHRKALAELH
jgi:hypothetical protein